MLLVIGLALLISGYLSFRFSDQLKPGKRGRQTQTQFPEWFPQLQKIGGLLFMITGLLLMIAYFII
ncbi:hypothetical protein [Alkalibacterium pelagium]|jgi:hypothetical protein|uniref:Uncharacterized protein n=1 Tax=Alkalibacterium pelagium TaxID=426702 RepID=A0A1H7J3S5_9LACT|nr:hypothetical protein [Alkalibacterium pelagium]GEN50293.1 hypothetical protein APE02nite_09580 [Alkalibacterium pelagium]SEK67785.1 hypothetical protein SAMN04488099_10535 [Alkalibacterium pelagium]